MNDAKMRGLSSLVGWDQFHGMVLTAHLAPVNLREEPIDELAKGLARNKKVEQEKTRNINQFALKQLEQNQTSEEERKKNEEFLKEVDLQAPKNGQIEPQTSYAFHHISPAFFFVHVSVFSKCAPPCC